MYIIWKILFIVAIILLVGSSAVGGYYWYKLDTTREQLAKQLANTEVQLDNTLGELDDTQVQLADTYVQLSTTEAQLVDVEAQLGTTEARLDMTTNQLETAKNENSKMINQYDGLKKQVNVRVGDTPEDKQSFITPSNSLVSTKVLEITGGYSGGVSEVWRDYKQLYSWVVSNISPSYDSYMPILPQSISGELIWQQDYWRMPEETIEDKIGDFEDMAVLLASMLQSHNEGKYQTWVLIIRSEESWYAAVACPVQDGKLAILDPAGNYYTGQYGSLKSESISTAVNMWINKLRRKMPGAEIAEVFSEDIYEEFSNTAEFITWAQE